MTQSEVPSHGAAASTSALSRRTRVAGVVSCVPKERIQNRDLVDGFGAGALQVISMTGVEERRQAPPHITTADLCIFAAEELVERLGRPATTIDAIIFMSQTPDYRLPATACLLQNRLGLRPGIPAFDVNLGCSAYPYGLWLGSMMIETGAARSVLLLVGDTISKIVAPEDRATAMLFGDAGTATMLVSDDSAPPLHFVLGSDGTGVPNLIVPHGGFRNLGASDPRNINPPDKLFMDGGEIFSFTLRAVPRLFTQLCEISCTSPADYRAVLFHQANSFMIEHLRKKMKLNTSQVPLNMDRYGNTSSASIPLLMVTSVRDLMLDGSSSRIGLLGFGVGYSWAAASFESAGLETAELVEYDFS